MNLTFGLATAPKRFDVDPSIKCTAAFTEGTTIHERSLVDILLEWEIMIRSQQDLLLRYTFHGCQLNFSLTQRVAYVEVHVESRDGLEAEDWDAAQQEQDVEHSQGDQQGRNLET